MTRTNLMVDWFASKIHRWRQHFDRLGKISFDTPEDWILRPFS